MKQLAVECSREQTVQDAPGVCDRELLTQLVTEPVREGTAGPAVCEDGRAGG